MQRAPECVESRVNSVHASSEFALPQPNEMFMPWAKGDIYDLLFVNQSLDTVPS